MPTTVTITLTVPQAVALEKALTYLLNKYPTLTPDEIRKDWTLTGHNLRALSGLAEALDTVMADVHDAHTATRTARKR